MLVYSIIVFLVAILFMGMRIAIYKGKTALIHDYHRTKVTNQAAIAQLATGLGIGVVCIVAVQKKYNKGVF